LATGEFVVPVINTPAVLVKTTRREKPPTVPAHHSPFFAVELVEEFLTGLAIELVAFKRFLAAVAG
jgi:hypothetical protein